MEKQYIFDDSCEFEGTTKEEVIEHINQWDRECVTLNIGPYKCKIHPSRITYYKERTGKTYETMLSDVLREFSPNGNKTQALTNLFEFYGDFFDENHPDEGLLSSTIDYTMCTIEDDLENVKEGLSQPVKTYKEMLTRNSPEYLMEKFIKENS